jgi:hypothetical protein
MKDFYPYQLKHKNLTINSDIQYTPPNTSFTPNTSLVFSRFLGGEIEDEIFGIDRDNLNNIYVTGVTLSSDFPVVNGIRPSEINHCTFVTKFSPKGVLLWSSVLGYGSMGKDIAIDSENNVIVTGGVVDSDFPLINAFDDYFDGQGNAFVAKISPEGNIIWSTLLGGSEWGEGISIAVDSKNDIIVTGNTISNDFPVKNAIQENRKGSGGFDWLWDTFISKFSRDGELKWSTYFGGSAEDLVSDLVVDNKDDILITGETYSNDFPVLNAFQPLHNGSAHADTFISKLTQDGQLVWSSYLGGEIDDYGLSITTDNKNNVLLTGRTFSTDFPSINSGNTTFENYTEGFIVSFTENGSILWSRFLGGNNFDTPHAILTDSEDNILITGTTHSSDFPTALFNSSGNASFSDIFLTKLNPNGSSLIWSFLFGGNSSDDAYCMTLDPWENPILAGSTSSFDFVITGYEDFHTSDECITNAICLDAVICYFNDPLTPEPRPIVINTTTSLQTSTQSSKPTQQQTPTYNITSGWHFLSLISIAIFLMQRKRR